MIYKWKRNYLLAIKALPDDYVDDETRICTVDDETVVCANPLMHPMIWTEKAGWLQIDMNTAEVKKPFTEVLGK